MCTFTDPVQVLSMEQRHKYIILFCTNCPQTQQLAQLLSEYWPQAKVQLVADVEALMACVARKTPDIILLPGVEKQDRYFISCIKMMRSKNEIDNIPVYVYNTIPVKKDLDLLWQQVNKNN